MILLRSRASFCWYDFLQTWLTIQQLPAAFLRKFSPLLIAKGHCLIDVLQTLFHVPLQKFGSVPDRKHNPWLTAHSEAQKLCLICCFTRQSPNPSWRICIAESKLEPSLMIFFLIVVYVPEFEAWSPSVFSMYLTPGFWSPVFSGIWWQPLMVPLSTTRRRSPSFKLRFQLFLGIFRAFVDFLFPSLNF